MTDYQVAVVGGGPAGLAAALTLSRSMIRTAVFDSPSPPRNAASPHIGAFPGMDLAAPADFRKTVAAEIGRYGYADIRSAAITAVATDADGGFTLSTDDGATVRAKRLLLATGMIDVFPEIDGLAVRWGTSVINCPFCHGYELRNRKWGILVHRPEILAAAEVYRNWTRDLVMFVAPDISLPQDRADAIENLGIKLVNGTVTALEGPGSALSHVVMADGSRTERDVFLVWPHQTQSDVIKALGLSLDKDGYVAVDEGFRTGTQKIYAAGDLTYGGHQNTNTAIHMGNMAAATMVFDLCQSDG